jgi:hypothetical protein
MWHERYIRRQCGYQLYDNSSDASFVCIAIFTDTVSVGSAGITVSPLGDVHEAQLHEHLRSSCCAPQGTMAWLLPRECRHGWWWQL